MDRLFLSIFFIICFATRIVIAQDSPYTDTVIILKDPHIVRKKVYANTTPERSSYRDFSRMLELSFASGKMLETQNFTPFIITNNQNFIVDILYYKQIRNIELGIGVGLSQTSFNYQKSNKSNDTYNTITYDKLLDTYIQRVNGKDSVIYITEKTDSVSINPGIVTESAGTCSFQYIQFPFSIGYNIKLLKRLSLIPRIQIIYGVFTNYLNENFPSPQNHLLSYSIQGNINYLISERIQVLLKLQLQQSLIPSFKEEITPKVEILSTGLGLGYRF